MKRTLTGLLLLFVATVSYGQQFGGSYGFRLGLTAHPTLGWVKPEIGKSNSVSLGFSYGLLGDFNFAENYSFSTRLTITTINGKSTEVVTTPGTGGNPASQAAYELKYKLQYAELPLTLKLRTARINDVRWYGQFGLSNGFNVGAKQDADLDGSAVYRDRKISDDIKFYRAGLIIGAGAEFDLSGQSSITAGLSYDNGFTNITNNKGNNVRNHYIALNFGVFF